jgi:hypothetical protein
MCLILPHVQSNSALSRPKNNRMMPDLVTHIVKSALYIKLKREFHEPVNSKRHASDYMKI